MSIVGGASSSDQSSLVLILAQALADPEGTLAKIIKEQGRLEELIKRAAPAQTLLELQQAAADQLVANEKAEAAAKAAIDASFQEAKAKLSDIQAEGAKAVELAQAQVKNAQDSLGFLNSQIANAEISLADTKKKCGEELAALQVKVNEANEAFANKALELDQREKLIDARELTVQFKEDRLKQAVALIAE